TGRAPTGPARLRRREAAGTNLILTAALIVAAGTAAALIHRGATATPTPTTVASGPLVPGDNATFVADLTIPDGTTVDVGQRFVKTWKIRNSGTVPWHHRYEQRQGLRQGKGLWWTPDRVPVPDTLPGADTIIRVTVVAPDLPGSCRVDWKMTDSQDRLFFPNLTDGIYFVVNVVNP